MSAVDTAADQIAEADLGCSAGRICRTHPEKLQDRRRRRHHHGLRTVANPSTLKEDEMNMSNTDFRTDNRSITRISPASCSRPARTRRAGLAGASARRPIRRSGTRRAWRGREGDRSHAADKLKEQISARADAGADYAQRFAENIRGAAKAFSQDTPIAARTIEMAAGYVEDAARRCATARCTI